ncbi:hypothetical protein C7T35_01405 [Variovorax sp. WS11]|uniref:hypothetical protein n=1 Tax=Variovorax sp. WS11 TaxID=1105204 RepID=UPI000D0D4C09|nr:hypothetical protein [Variovorax sp. WS11]NDZ11491.1 hypothetical protein [Variovorax sp. WS11]PSL86651.1 hypothetical protein C7T35_01405 [Variovorax sp. WS11]
MAIITAKNLGTSAFGGTPYGNLSRRHFVLETNASGALVGGNSTAAIGATDKVILGVLPAGLRLDDSLLIISDAFTATITGDIGFEYVDGVDDSAVPQDPDYFFASVAITAARTRQTTAVKPVTLPKDAYLTWTNEVAAHASVGRADIFIDGEDRGPQ